MAANKGCPADLEALHGNVYVDSRDCHIGGAVLCKAVPTLLLCLFFNRAYQRPLQYDSDDHLHAEAQRRAMATDQQAITIVPERQGL